MKNLLLTTCMFAALMAASVAPSLADDRSCAGECPIKLAAACQDYCKSNAKTCKDQCSDPQEQEQCIVDCDRSECKAGCSRFEETCIQRCPKPGG
jgi:hypothetical protein